MYKVCADINDVEFREIIADQRFSAECKAIARCWLTNNSKLMFLCSPNNPTSNSSEQEISCYHW